MRRLFIGLWPLFFTPSQAERARARAAHVIKRFARVVLSKVKSRSARRGLGRVDGGSESDGATGYKTIGFSIYDDFISV